MYFLYIIFFFRKNSKVRIRIWRLIVEKNRRRFTLIVKIIIRIINQIRRR